MADQLDLFGNVARKKTQRQPSMPRFFSYCYMCGTRIPEGKEIPVAFHTDYCQRCYDTAMASKRE